MLRLTTHALERIAERGLTAAQLANALDGRQYVMPDGTTIHLGPGRVAVVVNPAAQVVVTAYRIQRKLLKRHFSR